MDFIGVSVSKSTSHVAPAESGQGGGWGLILRTSLENEHVVLLACRWGNSTQTMEGRGMAEFGQAVTV